MRPRGGRGARPGRCLGRHEPGPQARAAGRGAARDARRWRTAWTELGSRHEGLDPGGADAAEEAIVGPYIFMRGTRLHRDALAAIARDGLPADPGRRAHPRPMGGVVARVMPTDLADRLTYLGTTADVWMDRSVTVASLPETMATAYRTPPPGRVCLVLGAGNASSIGPLDVIHKLFVEQQVVVLKMHPVMASPGRGPGGRPGPARPRGRPADRPRRCGSRAGTWPRTRAWTRSTSPARTGPTRRSCSGRVARATSASSATTRSSTSRSRRSSATSRRSSWCPADGRHAELDYHAENIVTMLTNNAGFNCTTSRVIVTAAGWPQRVALMDRIRARLAGSPTRLAFYPGARERWSAFREVHAESELFGTDAGGHLPWMLIPGLSPGCRRRPVLPRGGLLRGHRGDHDRRGRRRDFLDSAIGLRQRPAVGDAQRHADRGPAHRARSRPRDPRSTARSPGCATGRSRSTTGRRSATASGSRPGAPRPGTCGPTSDRARGSCTTR